MESVWFSPALAEKIINDSDDLYEHTNNIVTDIISNKLDMTMFVENMRGVLTNKEADNRERGMRFFTKVLADIPSNYLSTTQIAFISKFYCDRLKDNHRVIPPVLEGYLTLIDMKNYEVKLSAQFFVDLFREVTCQSQVRQDRYHIYLIIKKIFSRDVQFIKSLGPDFVYGVISAIDGERDPRNLLLLFKFLAEFIAEIPLGHLNDEMFDVISCYYPIDFHPAPDDPAPVTRQDLANALCPCLCATPAFGEQCLVMLIEKLDSALQVAKIDSLKLLTESCKTFRAETYGPFLKVLWSSIRREITNKLDESIKIVAHEALYALVKKLSTTANTDRSFEGFIEGILISMQATIAESTTVTQFVQATKVLATTANASKESCFLITGTMIPSMIAFYEFSTIKNLQICSLNFLADLYDLAKHWDLLDRIEKQVKEISNHCLTVASNMQREYQIAGFKTLIRVIDLMEEELVVPFVEILIHNVQTSHDTEVLSVSVETVHHIAKKYPELIMNTVVEGKCDLNNLTADKNAIMERLNLLSTLLSLDDFTKVIIEEMLKLITSNDKEAPKVIEALSQSMSNTGLYSEQKVTQIESDHNLLNSVMSWLEIEMQSNTSIDALSHGFNLISNTISSLPAAKQLNMLDKHTKRILDTCRENEDYYLVLESLYNSVHQNVHSGMFLEVMNTSLYMALRSENVLIRKKACGLIAHFLNKAEYGPNFELLYESLKDYLSNCSDLDSSVCPRLINLYGWIAKALVLRGSEVFKFWLSKIVTLLNNPDYSKESANAIQLIMSSQPDYFTQKHHCRTSLLYKQRMFIAFSGMAENPSKVIEEVKEYYLLSWAYVIGKAPKNVIDGEVTKIVPLVIESLEYDNVELLLVMLDVLTHFVTAADTTIADSLQSILPRLINLSRYVDFMDVRMKALQCVHDIADNYRTSLLLPYKRDMLLDLAPPLDDKKRLVRNMAVRARSRWYLVGAPGEPKSN